MPRKLRKQPVARYSPWDMAREAGERVSLSVGNTPGQEVAWMLDLYYTTDSAVDLSYRIVKKDGSLRAAYLQDDGFWYWP